VLEATVWIFFSLRVLYIVAVTAAPVAALTAATMAIVVFDMVEGFEKGGVLLVYFLI
jgi:hypothetical protein